MTPLAIVAALQYYLPHRTGYTLHVQRVCEALASRGHRMTVLTARHRPELARAETIAGVDVVRLDAPLRVSRGALSPGYPRAAWRLARDAGVVWVNSPMAEAPLWAYIAKRAGARLVATHHGDLHLPPGAVNRAIERATYAAWCYTAKRADAIVAYSDDYARASRWLAPWSDRIVANFPPILAAEPDPAEVAALARELNPEGGPIVGFAGRFAREKRPDLLLDALGPLRARHPGLALAFAGEHRLGYESTWSDLAPRVRAAGAAVSFLGLVDDPKRLAAFYAACDVLVLPSDTECFGLVQVEAMLCGTPVVASDIPGARVPVLRTGAGRLFEAGSLPSLVEAVDAVLRAPDRYRPDPGRVRGAFDFARTIDVYERAFAGR